MAHDPRFDNPDPKTIITIAMYGCHNKPRPISGQPVPSKDIENPTYPYRFSTDCRYDQSITDTRCSGCEHSKEFKDWHQKT